VEAALDAAGQQRRRDQRAAAQHQHDLRPGRALEPQAAVRREGDAGQGGRDGERQRGVDAEARHRERAHAAARRPGAKAAGER
jgi:hypothetical protein